MAAKLVVDSLAGIEDRLLDLDRCAAPLFHGRGKDLGHGAFVFLAELEGLFAIELPSRSWSRNRRTKGRGITRPRRRAMNRSKTNTIKRERAPSDRVHQRPAVVKGGEHVFGGNGRGAGEEEFPASLGSCAASRGNCRLLASRSVKTTPAQRNWERSGRENIVYGNPLPVNAS